MKSLTPILESAFESYMPISEKQLGRHRRPSRRKRRTWQLDIYAPVPQTTKPCGFTGDTLTEAVWLPYKDQDGNIELKPSVVIATKEGYKIVDFWKGNHNIKGTFPAQLSTLMTPQAVQILESKMILEPKEMDDALNKAFQKHLEMPKAEQIICKRWIEGTYFYDIFDSYPIQSILGVSESGKSRLCLLNLATCYHAESLIDPTEASIFRSKEEDKTTLVVDEAEYLNNPQVYATLRILINASYSKASGYVTRYDEQDGRRIKRRFDLYSPMAISGIGGLEGVTLSRAFRVVMRRTDKDYPKAYVQDYTFLRNCLYVLRIRHAFELREIYEKLDISNIVTARFEELFKPLFALTRFMGTQEEYDILHAWCHDYQENFRTEALNVAEEELVLLSLIKTEEELGHPNWYNLKNITKIFNLEHYRQVSPKFVSNILYRLGLTKRKKLHGYTLVYAPKEMLEEASKRIGVRLPEQLPTPSHPTPQDWKETLVPK